MYSTITRKTKASILVKNSKSLLNFPGCKKTFY